MLKLIIGNKAYSSWSLRGWLAVKQSGLPFEEIVVPLYGDDWTATREGRQFAPSGGKVPILWDGEIAIWDSLAIVEWLAENTGRARFWPGEQAARAMARSIAAEMHSSFANLRRDLSMNVRRQFAPRELSVDVKSEIGRIFEIWAKARDRHGIGGPYLFGDFGAADIMFAPVATRFATYSIAMPDIAAAYVEAVLDHPWMREWINSANDETWVIEQYEMPTAPNGQ